MRKLPCLYMSQPNSLAPNICHVVPTTHPILRRPWVVYVCNEALHVIPNVDCRDALDVDSLHAPFVSKSFWLFWFGQGPRAKEQKAW